MLKVSKDVSGDKERINATCLLRTQSDWVRFAAEKETQTIDLVGARPAGVDRRTFLISGRGTIYTDTAAETEVLAVAPYDFFRFVELT